jgi:primosomal protein N' (replication factor Y) (superfamily II helicase)
LSILTNPFNHTDIPTFADIILPVAVRGKFTYRIPDELQGKIVPGVRVTVPFGNRDLFYGIVSAVHDRQPDFKNIKSIIAIPEIVPALNEKQLRLWTWISEYYMCTEGEVMKAALPSETSMDEYKPKLESFISLSKDYSEPELNQILDKLARAPQQLTLLSSYLRLSGYPEVKDLMMISRQTLLSDSGTSAATLDQLLKKGILKLVTSKVTRLDESDIGSEPVRELSTAQVAAYSSVKAQFAEKDIVLLHGVTSSGKTELYIHLIEEQIRAGKQVLYLLPEIALTTQIIKRLRRHFGSVTGIYHSRCSNAEKVEIWNRVASEDQDSGYRLILGVRSSIFLPFNNLGLIIIDEEHDGSYKQHDPAPRYHARDTAIMLAGIYSAKTLLGSASPSIESYNNTINGKYGLSELKERFGMIRLPAIVLANVRDATRKKLMVSHFTPELLEAIDDALGKNEQVILFQNRRGFSPYIECADCGWVPVCMQCAVNLTYHKSIGRLVCHYCGYSVGVPHHCGSCNSTGLITRGFGTEKIEDEIKIVFPDARVARMDQDTTRGKNSFANIIRAFEEKRIDILIGTQMISKGLDFENLTVVGILNADNMLNFPDFRAHERSYQLMEQVSGRAGRRQKQGKVVIQTSDPSNRIIRLVLRHDYEGMFRMQAGDRKDFNYPPFCRLIRITMRHKDKLLLNQFSGILGDDLKNLFGKRVLGPEFPLISQVQMWHIKTILIKIEREKPPARAKELINEAITRIEQEKGSSGFRIAVDVDPY